MIPCIYRDPFASNRNGIKCRALQARNTKPVRSRKISPPSADPESDDEFIKLFSSEQQCTNNEKLDVAVTKSTYLDPYTPMPATNIHMDATSSSGFFFKSKQDLMRKLQLPAKKSENSRSWPVSTDFLEKNGHVTSYKYSVDQGAVVDMIALKKAVPQPFDRAFSEVSLRTNQETMIEHSGGMYLSPSTSSGQDNLNDELFPVGSSSGFRQSIPKLRVFLYCVTVNELFPSLWELDLLHKVEWALSMQAADLVIHRRPMQGEKQFQYEDYRDKAKELGIPFVSINSETVPELRKSLLPVFKLYEGKESISQILKKGRRGSHSKRIRL
ncbi:hypothetical protein CEUSTIGMA_g10288.t1 [Chlamydomonas eustigma]|uniref:Uncharacterized protein n=1 Tax=Chlamydomonas eustigma TaxID=1157962 RepID=A0A250XIX8_9CHLO|nr:hypothetical protein CEUSTIGMA_g10288.t1 [Chlamydomonas eustigma]|eukprot:GAX82862.1 hypothetical protein CEUSTIGMA_g10288.t1 [Chlamydomonas eustigma]